MDSVRGVWERILALHNPHSTRTLRVHDAHLSHIPKRIENSQNGQKPYD